MTQLSQKLSEELHRDLADVERLRGELALQAHLMTMETKTRWRAFEKKLETLRNHAKMGMATAFRQLAQDLKTDYAKLKDEIRTVV